jgi:hypothetical protein
MKNKIIFLLTLILLASCKQIITIEPPPPNIRVYNSAWQIVRADRLESRNITSTADLEAYVEQYNQANTDDQLFLIPGEAEVPIEQAPSANAWIVDATTYDIKEEYLALPRVQLETDREVWRLQLRNVGNALLFVDRIPPRPEPPPVISDYEKYACYLIDENGGIVFETHCEGWQEAGYSDIQSYFDYYARAVRYDALNNPGWSYVTGRLYVEP